MRLTRPTGRGVATRSGPRTPTTEPGFANPHRQVVERATGQPSAVRDHQVVYALRCRDCEFVYGCNGLDIKERCCPRCQGGVAGEPLPERSPGLFDELP